MKYSSIAIITPILITCSFSAEAGFESLNYGVSADIDVTAGLDKETRELIRSMPKEIKEQALDGLRQALPLLDKSVHSYFDRVDQIINGVGVAAYCATYAGAGGVRDSITGVSSKAAGLENKLHRTRSKFESNTTPKQYESAYSIIENEAQSYLCPLGVGTLQWTDIMAVRSEAHDTGFMWRRLMPLCDSAYKCEDTVRAQTNVIIEKIANPLDVKNLRSAERMNSLTPMPPPSFWPWNDGYNIDLLETNLAIMLRINDELVLAKYIRDKNTEEQMKKYSEKYAILNSQYDSAIRFNSIRDPNIREVTPACHLYYASPTKINELSMELEKLKAFKNLPPETETQVTDSYNSLKSKLTILPRLIEAKPRVIIKNGICRYQFFGASPSIPGGTIPIN